MSAEFEAAYNVLTSKLDISSITPENMMIYVKTAMEIVEMTHLKGAEQKHLVIEIMYKIIKEANLSAEYNSICMDFIDSGALSQTIDIIVDASKGRLDINKPMSIIKRIAMCCFPFIKRRTSA